MFDHLDDPHPPDLGSLRAPVLGTGRRRRRRRRWGQSLASVVVVLAVVGAGLGLVDRRLANVDRVQVDIGTPPPVGAEPISMLLVGTDRGIEGLPDDGSRPARGLADSLVLVRLDPSSSSVRLLSVPRDLWVTRADGTGSRLNQVFGDQGPQALVDAVAAATGTHVDHYVEVDLAGITGALDAVGGLPLQATAEVRDPQTGFQQAPGCRVVDGREALGYLRARHLEWRDASGRWAEDPTSDLGRMARGREAAAALLARLATSHDPLDVVSAVDRVLGHVTIDASWRRDDLVGLVQQVRTIDPAAIAGTALDTTPGVEAGGAVLRATPGSASEAAAFLHGSSSTGSSSAPPDGGVAPVHAVAGCP